MTPGDTTVEFARRCRHCGSQLSATSPFCSKCGAKAEIIAPGADPLREQLRTLFGEDLDIEREIGRGGMAAVYAGYDPALQRRVAIKVLLPEIANDRGAADRFLREARTVAALQHPHVVTVYAVRSRDGVHAIVMQFVEGRSLDAALQDRGTFPASVAGMLLAQAADGLQHAHDRGVIHRDVKPANVLIEHDGRAIVSDFGIARRESGPRTTDTGLVVGTWAYMSPEQRAADSVTAATDQYALGVMAFELLTGKLPFSGTPADVMRAHMYTPPPSLIELRPGLSPQVEAIVHRMMAKDPAARFPSLRDAERAFRSLIADEGKTTIQLAAYSKVQTAAKAGASQVIAAAVHPATAPVRQSAPTVRGAADVAATARPSVPARGRGGVIVGVLAGGVVLGVAWMLTRRDGSAPPAPSSPAGASAATSTQAAPATPPAVTPDAKAPAQTATEQPRSKAQEAGTVAPPRPNSDATIGGGVVSARPLVSPTVEVQPRAAVPNPPTVDSAARPAPLPVAAPPRTEPAPAPAAPPSTTADARRIGNQFITMLNQRRYRELAQIPAMGGDATLRAELLQLAETARDLAAGFDRLPSAPGPWTNGFETDFEVDLQWRGGKKLMRIQLFASHSEGVWRLAGMAVSPAN